MTKRGRPTIYSRAITDEICERIAQGQSLITICKDKHLPCVRLVQGWLSDESKILFLQDYACARDAQADYYADEMLSIAENEPDVQRARLQIDTRKWIASKLKPKKYGDKLAIGGADDLPAIKQDHTLSPEESYMRAIEGKK